MLQQHWEGLSVDSQVRAAGAVRFAWTRVFALVILAFVATGVAMNPGRPVTIADDEDLSGGESARFRAAEQSQPQAADLLKQAAEEPSARSTHAVRHLSTGLEQAAIARFLASKYQLALDRMQEIVSIAYSTGREVRVDPLLLLAVAGVESRFDAEAESGQGAQGLMQVHTRVHADKFEPFGGASAAFDPLANMKVGARILKDYLKRDGTVEGALKAYVGAADLGSDRGYGAKVLSERARLLAASGRVPR